MSHTYSCFISYRRNEERRVFISNLKAILQSELFDLTNKNRAFLDNDSIRYGEEFDVKIYFGIENAYFFIPLWTPNYLHKDNLWCARELYHAIQLEEKIKDRLKDDDKLNWYYIIPIVVNGNKDYLPKCISRNNAIDIQFYTTDIINKKTTQKLIKLRRSFFDCVDAYYRTVKKYFELIDFRELNESIVKPDDVVLKNWVSLQESEIQVLESTHLPILKKSNG